MLVLVDLMLRTDGGPNGLELAREIKVSSPRNCGSFSTSAYYLSERQLERADCGVSGFIPKPYDVGEVVSFIRAKVSGPPSSRRLWHAEATSGVVDVTSDSSAAPPSPAAGEPPRDADRRSRARRAELAAMAAGCASTRSTMRCRPS